MVTAFSGSHDIYSMRDMRDALGALGPVDGQNPELNNLTCSLTYCDHGDIVFLTSDGISDNFDPVVGKFAIPRKEKESKTPSKEPQGTTDASSFGKDAKEEQNGVQETSGEERAKQPSRDTSSSGQGRRNGERHQSSRTSSQQQQQQRGRPRRSPQQSNRPQQTKRSSQQASSRPQQPSRLSQQTRDQQPSSAARGSKQVCFHIDIFHL